MVTIAVDVMGSDNGPKVFAEGLERYLRENDDVSFICFGRREAKSLFINMRRVSFVECDEVVPMETNVLGFLRLKESSMYKALAAVRENKAQGLVTAGSTGGFLTGSTLLLRNIEGVGRAGFCSPFPTPVKDKAAVILDVGASNVNSADELVGFAKLGKIYAETIYGMTDPSVFLLSNGTEEGKGLAEAVEAYKILKAEKGINFGGNAEARDVLDGKHDVIVTSGYPGNVFLKATEGCAHIMNSMIKKAFKRNVFSMLGYLLAKKGFNDMKKTMDYKKTGGAILLGINGVVCKTHGNADGLAVYYSLGLAYRMIRSDIIGRIKAEFKGA